MSIRIVVSEGDGVRIDRWLAGHLESYSRSYIQKLITDGNIEINGLPAKNNYKVRIDDHVDICIPDPALTHILPENISIGIIYEDDDLLVVNKPKGMVVHPGAGNHTGTLVNALLACCGDRLSDINGIIRPGIVHRLDKDTSGLLLVAKNNVSHENLSRALKNHEIKRIYSTVVKGIIEAAKGKIDAPLGRHRADRKRFAVSCPDGKHAVTHFSVLERFTDASYLDVELETGRTHQIRVHLSYIGHPVLGDKVYGKEFFALPTSGQVLHARRLTFEHPSGKGPMSFEAPLPDYFVKVLEFLRKEQSHNL